jgi:hypothetical protein
VKSEGPLGGVMMVTVQGWKEKEKKTRRKGGKYEEDAEEEDAGEPEDALSGEAAKGP